MKDPVCGMEVSSHGANCTDFQGQHFCFCSQGCKQSFEQDPQKYVGQKGGSMQGKGEQRGKQEI